ncbi:MAG: AAA family ATPase [bacterium]|nr:AAA family ATPase [bacterium]
MIQFPYGIADFRRIRREGMVYVDRTAHIRDLEALGSILVFLRPRRFGKSLWLQTLATYYDLRYADAFDEIFGGLAVHHSSSAASEGGPRGPTPLAHRFFVLQWNFSTVNASGGVREIAESLEEHVREQIKAFVVSYRDHLGYPVATDGSPAAMLTSLLSAVSQTPYKLYLLIDEYDNFVNEVMVRDPETYHALFGKDGPYKQLFKSVKAATEGQGLERVFVTGVSPVALNDLTSGFNNATDVSLEPELAGLCGFDETEIRDLLRPVAEERRLGPEEVDRLLGVMRVWYNGYRFSSRGSGRLVYNPTNTLFLLRELYRHGHPPESLHDANLRTDQTKLAFLARTVAGTGVVEELTEGTGEIRIPRLLDTFSLEDMVKRISRDRGAVASFLYYMGMLTLTGEPGRLRIPNLVVRKLFLDRLLEVFLPDPAESYEAREVALRFFDNGELRPLLDFFEEKLLPVLSNRDQGAPPKKPGHSGSGVNEMVLKALLLSILFDDQRFVVHSELEIERGYADLCLLVRPENRYRQAFDILFELKLVRRKTLGKTGRELREMGEAALRRLPAVKEALDDARDQVERYRDALVRQRGETARPRCYAVLAVGLERLLGDEVESGPETP